MSQGQSTIVRRLLIGGPALWALALASAPSGVLRAQDGGRKIWDGVYTEAQAARGKPAYETSCGRCHNNELAGSERAPALKGDGFWAHWENDSLDRLFTKIRDTMPSGGIESVTDAGKLDILAYVLSKNEAAPGKDELSLDTSKLEVGAYQAAARAGQRVEARGLIYRSEGENVINLTSLHPLNQPCP